MLIGIFSDLHAHPFKPYATILADGMNSRLADSISCVNQIRDVCVARGVDLVLFGGDLFHTRGRLAVQAFNAVYESIAGFRVHKIPVAMIHGNHDQADREGSVYSIHTLRTVADIVDKPGWTAFQGKNNQNVAVLAVPYTENVEHLRDLTHAPPPTGQLPKLFLGHFGVNGGKVGSDFVYTSMHDATVADLHQDIFDAGFLGHFHLHQKVGKNFVFIGAPQQHNWGDRDDPGRGFLLYDTETRTTERVPLKSPEFRLLTTLDKKSKEHKDCFIRLTSDRAWSEDEREAWRVSLGARAFEIVESVTNGTKITASRLDVGPTATYKDMVERYVASGLQPTEGLDPEYLTQLGLELLEEAMGDAE